MNKPFNPLSGPTQAADDYYAEGERWSQEVYDQAAKSKKRAWALAYTMVGVAAMSVGAVLLLTPLKEVQPYVVLVDKTTGYMERIDRVSPATLTQNEALVRADVVRFLQSHEIWDPTDFQERARYVRLASTSQVYQLYLDAINLRAEDLTLEDQREIYIKSVSVDTEAGTAFVRFSTETIVRGRVREEHWAASLKYRYTSTPAERDVAFVNPFGFQVERLRVDQESIREGEE